MSIVASGTIIPYLLLPRMQTSQKQAYVCVENKRLQIRMDALHGRAMGVALTENLLGTMSTLL